MAKLTGKAVKRTIAPGHLRKHWYRMLGKVMCSRRGHKWVIGIGFHICKRCRITE